MTDIKLKDKYVGPRTEQEIIRLHAQHDVVRSAFGGKLILCPIDLSRSNLHILDSATSDGYFLYDLWRTELGDPDSAVLIGTDIASFPELSGLPPNITLERQNIMEDWPTGWKGTFDLVHQRNVLPYTGSLEDAVETVRRLAGLVKPGGWIQLVDYYTPDEPIQDGDKPSTKLLKLFGQYLKRHGFDNSNGRRVGEILKNISGLENIGVRTGVSILGKGEPEEMAETCKIQVQGIVDFIGQALKKENEPVIPLEEYEKILGAFLEQVKERGVELHWFSAWGQQS
jgi:gliotoxin biosynthesis N-methyltransferase